MKLTGTAYMLNLIVACVICLRYSTVQARLTSRHREKIQQTVHGLMSKTVGLDFACPPPLRRARCNVDKYIPTSSLDMPPGWQPYSRHWRSETHSCCAVSDAYRFIYIKLAKTASSTILPGYLRPNACAARGNDSKQFVVYADPGARFSANCTDFEFRPRDTDCYPCDTIERWKWIHYYVFASVRNPFQRAVSSYTYCRKGDANITFEEWCMNPDMGGGICGSKIDKPNVHWGPQADSLCRKKSCVVDFLVRAETLQRDMDVVVHSINAVRNQTYPPLPKFASAATIINRQNMSRCSDSALLNEFPDCVEAIKAWYRQDFEMLNYSKVPP